MPEQGHIRVHGHGEIEVELIVSYLADLRHAYNSILVFESAMDGLSRSYRDFGYPFYYGNLAFHLPRRGIRAARDWPSTPEEVASLVPNVEQLVLAGVRLQSPGFWDFVGKLNPLEVIRLYLNDRHERRKDREYRESAEARKLTLENLKLENEVIASRIQLAKELGATERDLAPLLNELVFRPLTGLDRHQDKGVIENVEVPRLPGQGQ
ncbi:hypothetical protein [Rhodanobacter aciditrophus]|uniref:hypothetical protein n=1 Tax=Rhodanobacter aciditrophus TaxID=1623218 RepID=UPI003CEA5BD9